MDPVTFTAMGRGTGLPCSSFSMSMGVTSCMRIRPVNAIISSLSGVSFVAMPGMGEMPRASILAARLAERSSSSPPKR